MEKTDRKETVFSFCLICFRPVTFSSQISEGGLCLVWGQPFLKSGQNQSARRQREACSSTIKWYRMFCGGATKAISVRSLLMCRLHFNSLSFNLILQNLSWNTSNSEKVGPKKTKNISRSKKKIFLDGSARAAGQAVCQHLPTQSGSTSLQANTAQCSVSSLVILRETRIFCCGGSR